MAAIVLIITTIVITLMAWYLRPDWQVKGMLRPYEAYREGKWYQLITSGFLHGNSTHLLFNMITFFFFGPQLEQIIGTGLFLLLYFSALIISSIPTLFLHRNNPNYASLGASGAVGAVIFSYILFYPLSNLYIIFIPVGIPAVLFGILFLVVSYYAGRRQLGAINHDAHFTGAVYGLLFTLIFIPRSFENFLSAVGIM